MLVEAETWSKLIAEAQERDAGDGLLLPVPHPWHLIAMKLVAAKSETRRASAVDWGDILDLICTCGIDVADPEFQKVVMKFGGEEALLRIQRKGREDGR